MAVLRPRANSYRPAAGDYRWIDRYRFVGRAGCVAICGRFTKYTFGSSMTHGVLHVRPSSCEQTLKKKVFSISVR